MKKNAYGGVHLQTPFIRKTILFMKLSAIFLFLALQVSAANHAQEKISLKAKNVSLSEVFKAIEKQTSYRFNYSNDILPIDKLVSIKAVEADIKTVLNKMFNGIPVKWTIEKSNNIFLTAATETAVVSKIITGTITNEKGEPLDNVSIVVKGTTTGTLTNAAGQFSINVPDNGAVLEISRVGYETKEVAVTTAGDVVNVILETAKGSMDEVVVVAYGTQKKVNLTGAVATIDNKILEDRPVARLSQALQGAVANLNIMNTYSGGSPNAKQTLNIRGYTGIGSTGSPLIVIDGVQGGDFDALNPNDVESISVIKDASASAIYGSSAPYGVILITTKKGKLGKPTVTYNGSVIINTPIGLPKMMNSIDFANIYNEAGYNAGQGTNNFFSVATIQRLKDYQAGLIKTETSANPNAGQDNWMGWFASNANNDWFKIYYKNAQTLQQHNLSLSGGTDKTRYFVGLGYNDKPGMYNYGKDIYKKFNVRANLSTKVTDWLDFNFRTAYSKENYDAPNAGGSRTGDNWMHQLARKHPNIALYLPNGEFSEISDVPYQLYGGRHTETADKPIITGEIVIAPIKGWATTMNYTYEANFWANSDHLKTLYQTLPSGKTAVLDWTSPNRFSRTTGFESHQVFNLFSSYEYQLKLHNFKILGGYVREFNDKLGLWGGNSYLYTDNVPSISTSYGKTASVADSRVQLATEGYFGRFNYNFDERYLLEVSGRYDATSRFLAANRWKFYPGMSAGWNVDKEAFWNNLGAFSRAINTLKLRGSYGIVGDQISDYKDNWYPFFPSLGTRGATNTSWYFNNGLEAATSAPGLIDPSVTWVSQKTLDFGVDITALRNRLAFTFDWYKKTAVDYLGAIGNFPAILGTGVPLGNVLGMENKGFDLTISWKDKIGDVAYTIRGTLGDYKGIVTKYPNDLKIIGNKDDGYSRNFVGRVMGDIYGFQTDRYFTGDADVAASPNQNYIYTKWGAGDIKYVDINGDGKIDIGANKVGDMGDLKVIGNSTPRYSYGLYADFTWKNFDGSFFIQGIAKRDVWVGGNYFWGINGSEWQSSPFTVHNDRWTPSTPDGYFPKFYMSGENDKNTQVQSKYLQSAAYMRLKNIQVGYTLPQTIFSKPFMQKLRFYAMVENVFTITPLRKHSNIDPEIFFSDSKIYPLQRSYSAGISVTF